ncbi:MAG TPA: hypothetical protein VE981_04390 [Planctomycetota bacterium]|nr:hypothetical protein [Planctomycetota bacterium]
MNLGRALGLLALLSSSLAADVALLKDGSRVAGKVVEKGTSVEITTDAGLRAYAKDEVDRIVKNPADILGDVDKVISQAKTDYQAALAMPDGPDKNAMLRDTIAKVDLARAAVSSTRELFPEDKYADLDQKLMQVMQLKRLLRDRLHSEFGVRSTIGPSPTPGLSSVSLEEAFTTLFDPARRSDAGRRASARESFRLERSNHPEIYEIATAAMLFLSRSDAEWNLQGASLAAIQDYFTQSWLKQPTALTPALHQAAAQWIIERIATLKKSDAKAQTDAMSLFGIGHLGQSPPGAETDKGARLLGLEVRNGILGTPEGHAVRDLDAWIAGGDFDLAVFSFIKEYRGTDTPIVRFVWSYALLRMVQARKRNFERPVSALQTISVSDGPTKEHINALVKSIKSVAVCNACQGAVRLRCTNCLGKKETRWDCVKCKGTGKVTDELGYQLPCYPCRGRGYDKLLRCEKCKDGYFDCKQCDRKQRQAPEMDDICTSVACVQCDGRGYVFRNILWACKSCMGLGIKLQPKVDPAKTLQ